MADRLYRSWLPYLFFPFLLVSSTPSSASASAYASYLHPSFSRLTPPLFLIPLLLLCLINPAFSPYSSPLPTSPALALISSHTPSLPCLSSSLNSLLILPLLLISSIPLLPAPCSCSSSPTLTLLQPTSPQNPTR